MHSFVYSVVALINNNNLSGKQLCCYFGLPAHEMSCPHLYEHLVFGVFWNHRHNLVFIPMVCLFITHFIIIRCRVQPMITDQTVAINMKVRKRFSLLADVVGVALFLFIFILSFISCVFACVLAVKCESMKTMSEDGKRNFAAKSRPMWNSKRHKTRHCDKNATFEATKRNQLKIRTTSIEIENTTSSSPSWTYFALSCAYRSPDGTKFTQLHCEHFALLCCEFKIVIEIWTVGKVQ